MDHHSDMGISGYLKKIDISMMEIPVHEWFSVFIRTVEDPNNFIFKKLRVTESGIIYPVKKFNELPIVECTDFNVNGTNLTDLIYDQKGVNINIYGFMSYESEQRKEIGDSFLRGCYGVAEYSGNTISTDELIPLIAYRYELLRRSIIN